LGPYFYDGTLNGRKYYNFFINKLQMMMADIPLVTRQNLIFQQDGTPAHNVIIVRNYLNEIFVNRWIGTYGPIK